MTLRHFTGSQVPALLDFVESRSSWGDEGRELGRSTFQDKLGLPGLLPEKNCLLLEEDGHIQGYALIFPEPPISRAVLELDIASKLHGSSQETELIRWAIAKAQKLSARTLHICLPETSGMIDALQAEEFSLARRYWDMVWQSDDLPLATIPDGVSVRPFLQGDAPILTEIQNAAFSGSWGFSPNTLEQIEYRISMADTSRLGILFLNLKDNTVGYCWTCLSPVENYIRGFIGMIGVLPEHRGQGISSIILLAGMRYLQSLDVADIRLQVDCSNTAAVRLYTSAGFEKAVELHWFERDLS